MYIRKLLADGTHIATIGVGLAGDFGFRDLRSADVVLMEDLGTRFQTAPTLNAIGVDTAKNRVSEIGVEGII